MDSWSPFISVAASIVVAILAYLGGKRGVRTQIDAAVLAVQRDERAEHARWLRDRAVETFLTVLDLSERCYDYRRHLYGRELSLDMGEQPDQLPETDTDTELAYRQVAARLELFGSRRLRELLATAKEAHETAVHELGLVLRGPVQEGEGLQVPDISVVHDHLDAGYPGRRGPSRGTG